MCNINNHQTYIYHNFLNRPLNAAYKKDSYISEKQLKYKLQENIKNITNWDGYLKKKQLAYFLF